ncbi:MAG TPA: GGDEF domain-containing protein [Xanthobacteraceae bacterium]|jgi:diguanylate cyclase (GGDEF)-like protein|nr:GGDEF domain-containing protein [Xanthobacteraceae bacterium]
MFAPISRAAISLDIGTLFVIATCVATLLGLFLLFAWMQERIKALAWWGLAYLIGGFSGALWRLEDVVSLPLPHGLADEMLFIALGMIWTAARLFHGRPIRWGAMCFGAVVWLAAYLSPIGPQSPTDRIILSSMIVAVYTFMIAAELSRERRKSVMRRWPALFVPMLHGAIFLMPVALASMGVKTLATGWTAVFAIQVVLYVVGAAFIVLVLAKDRSVSHYKAAAESDALTGLLNRRGFFEAVGALMVRNAPKQAPITVLAFDLDKFKSINDNYGHKTGDAVLTLFAKTARKTMRGNDILGRIGGEEFIAVISGTIDEACIAAERVRAAFQVAALSPDSPQIPATVSIGIASGSPTASIDLMIERADAMLYRAKESGRNRVEPDREFVLPAPPVVPKAEQKTDGRIPGAAQRADVRKIPAMQPLLQPVPALAVPILR